MTWTIVSVVLIVIGAVSGYKTLTNTFALAVDAFIAETTTNSKLPLKISTRAGLAARRGKNIWFANLINRIMGSPSHCEDSISFDTAVAIASLDVLLADSKLEELEALKRRVNFYYKAR